MNEPILIPMRLTEIEECRLLARKRSGKKLNKRFSKHSDNDANLYGLLGEYAACKTFDVPMASDMRYGGDGGTDINVNGWTIDVKIGNMKAVNKPGLIVTPGATADIFLLVWVNPDMLDFVWLAGWSYRQQLTERTTVDFGYGARWFVPYDELNSMNRLIRIEEAT